MYKKIFGNKSSNVIYFAIYFITLTLTMHNPLSYPKAGSPTTDNMRRVCAIGAGQYFYDTVVLGLYSHKLDRMTAFHHVVTICAMFYSIASHIDGYYMIQGTFIVELTNPFYNLYRVLQYIEYPPVIF